MNFIYNILRVILLKIKENLPLIKHYTLSSFITFLSGFVLALAAQVHTLDVQSFENGAALGLLMTGLRAGFKMLIEASVKKLAQSKV